MALIDFPNNPIVGTIYNFAVGTPQQKSYKFLAGQVGASDGYWSAVGGNVFNPASTAEIDAGVVADKYIAPDQLELSKYIRDTGDTMLSPLKGPQPQDPQDYATKSYVDNPPTVYKVEKNISVLEHLEVLNVVTGSNGLIDITGSASGYGIYYPPNPIGVSITMRIYEGASTVVAENVAIVQSSNSVADGQWVTATDRIVALLDPDTAYKVHLTVSYMTGTVNPRRVGMTGLTS